MNPKAVQGVLFPESDLTQDRMLSHSSFVCERARHPDVSHQDGRLLPDHRDPRVIKIDLALRNTNDPGFGGRIGLLDQIADLIKENSGGSLKVDGALELIEQSVRNDVNIDVRFYAADCLARLHPDTHIFHTIVRCLDSVTNVHSLSFNLEVGARLIDTITGLYDRVFPKRNDIIAIFEEPLLAIVRASTSSRSFAPVAAHAVNALAFMESAKLKELQGVLTEAPYPREVRQRAADLRSY